MSDPPIVVTNPTEIRKPPNEVLGPRGPKPDANVSANATIPTPKEIAPYLAKLFTASILAGLSKTTFAHSWRNR